MTTHPPIPPLRVSDTLTIETIKVHKNGTIFLCRLDFVTLEAAGYAGIWLQIFFHYLASARGHYRNNNTTAAKQALAISDKVAIHYQEHAKRPLRGVSLQSAGTKERKAVYEH